MINFVLLSVLAYLAFLGIAVAAFPDGDDDQKKNTILDLLNIQPGLYRLPPQLAAIYPYPQPVVVRALSPKQAQRPPQQEEEGTP